MLGGGGGSTLNIDPPHVLGIPSLRQDAITRGIPGPFKTEPGYLLLIDTCVTVAVG